mmetsp:Transcript_72788/g.137682  ORF Transcript_72788/g.137682 Transcript_72788/m.137682 type:complete len:932 (+) Transcript_72788:54-2849(+)
MGCASSSAAAADSPAAPRCQSRDNIRREQSRMSDASHASESDLQVYHERLRKLRELDCSTKIPFILVELRGCGHKDGYIEVCGKDEYGVYLHLEEWLLSTFRCIKMDPGDLRDDTPLPFCDALYKWEGFLEGKDGTSNMGLASMQLVDFMCGQLSWTLGVINGGNVGKAGEIREQQMIFKAPHPMNLHAQHMMIELRSAGYIEVCGSDRAAKDVLHHYFIENFAAKPCVGHQEYSDRYYECQSGIFKERGRSGENNLGQLTVKVCDAVVNHLPNWRLVTMNGGNYGEHGDHREQQLVFRCAVFDDHDWQCSSCGAQNAKRSSCFKCGAPKPQKTDDNLPQQPNHLLVELREAGYIEVCGEDPGNIYDSFSNWLTDSWDCKESSSANEAFCDKKFKWKPKDMMVASAEVTEFFHAHGWEMEVCSQGTVQVKGNSQSREQQLLFRPGGSDVGIVEPHLFIELYTGEGKMELYNQKNLTQVHANQYIRVREVGNCRQAVSRLGHFLEEYLGGNAEPQSDEWRSWGVDVFLSRGICDNNLGCWTMRLCDFMVDQLGWSFVVCNVCNLGEYGCFREQQLVFRYDGERREIPPVKIKEERLDEVRFVGLPFPVHWRNKDVLSLKQPVATVSCEPEEVAAMQEIFNATFKRVLTRDRVYEYQLKVSEEMPYRLEVVHVFRSEHAELYRKFMERRSSWKGGLGFKAKTAEAGALLNSRLGDGEALLAHGTNPSSAMGILKTGFSLNAAGKSTGTMFGYGIYLAECVSKSDEYARDDNGGTYPGLMALLICRCLVGNPYVVHDAGDYISEAKAQGCDCVVGDREAKVGTYREFIFYDERQVLPEYAVIYRRQYDHSKVPSLMRQSTRGTTGRNWQLKLDKGWHNCTPDVSFELTRAQNGGLTTYERKIGDITYTFDFTNMTQMNMESGTVRQIRPPMRRK